MCQQKIPKIFAATSWNIIFHFDISYSLLEQSIFLDPNITWNDFILNKCRPKLVQGLRQNIQINFHIIIIYGSLAQLVEC